MSSESRLRPAPDSPSPARNLSSLRQAFLRHPNPMSKPTTLTARVGDRDLHIETGKYAKLADGAALVTMGETII
ncbi:MAG: hypothetical protein EBS49_04645, partial [Verrucomicrobia bacterium]|nr:hypothetical protein [Verrucomicrobiota bacterium]